jgi:hypothetical protein
MFLTAQSFELLRDTIVNGCIAVWMIIAAGIAVVAIASAVHRRVNRTASLGWVTERWLTAHRAEQQSDSK